MTTFNAIDINAFCNLPIKIETRLDGGGTEWFVFSEQLREHAGIPEEFDLLENLEPDDWCLDIDEHFDGTTEEIELISEKVLYELILLSDEPSSKPFRNWVSKVMGPIVGYEGYYVIGEEEFCVPLGENHHLEDGDFEYKLWLAEAVLPEIRESGCYFDKSLQPTLKKIVNGNNPIEEMMDFLKELKGDRMKIDLLAR